VLASIPLILFQVIFYLFHYFYGVIVSNRLFLALVLCSGWCWWLL
jgi:hypothetical protein